MLGIDVNAELNNILEVRPQKHATSQKQNHVRHSQARSTILKNTASNSHSLHEHHPPSPSRASTCCSHCSIAHTQRSPTSQLTPPLDGVSPDFEFKAMNQLYMSREGAQSTQPHPHKRRRHYSTDASGRRSNGYSMMHQSFPYSQACYHLGKYHLFHISPLLKNYLILD